MRNGSYRHKVGRPLVPVHSIVDFANPDGLLDVAGSLVGFCGEQSGIILIDDLVVISD